MIVLFYLLSLFIFPYLMIQTNDHLILLWVFLSPLISFAFVFIFVAFHIPFFSFLKVNPHHFYINYLNQQMIMLFNHVFLRMKTTISGEIPKIHQQVIYSNHTSYTDALCVLEKVQMPMAFTPKVSILKVPFIGIWIQLLGSFPIDRINPRKTLENMVLAIQVVKNGQSMLMFPEGTIRDRYSNDVENIKAGAFKLVSKAQAQLTLIKISGDIDIRKKIPFYPVNRNIDVIATYSYDEIKDIPTKELSLMMMNQINQFKEHKDQ
ncbi:MAG: lysophospholipid acyltransferase family protein [Firmicutes bacterium]|nr:lysophospholipid acyltransferase family protein [Bacillota bacterium]